MNWNPIPWFVRRAIRAEAATWSTEGIIQSDQERRLVERYGGGCCGITVSECGRLTLSALAAAAMILSVVLITVDRWSLIHPWLKVSVALLLMAVAHGSGYWYRFQMHDAARGDACFFVGSMMFGCAMLLAAARAGGGLLYPWACFAWAGATLPLAWVLNSGALLALANVAGVAWFVGQMATVDASYTSLFVALALCLIRWSYVHRARALLILALLSLVLWWVMLTVAGQLGPERYFWIASLAPFLYVIGLRHDESDPFGAVFRHLGLALGVVMAWGLSLPSSSAAVLGPDRTLRYWLCAVAVATAVAAFVPGTRRLDLRREWIVLAVLGAITILPALLGLATGQLVAAGVDVAVVLLAAVMNALAVAIATAMILRGTSSDRAECVAFGAAYLGIWAVLVAFDLSHHLVAAALVFALAGAGLILAARLRLPRQASSHETSTIQDV